MSSFFLKVIAALSMLTDHVGLVFFPEFLIFHIIGRLAFPLFAFLIAEGFIKTSNAGKYLTRLLLFALISQLPFYLAKTSAGIEIIEYNILFTLSLGLICLILLKKIKSPFLSIPVISFLVYSAEIIQLEYGSYGILLILASYALLLKKGIGSIVWSFANLAGTVVFFPINIAALQILSFGALPLMLSYNGKRGKLVNKWWFYWFYPIHLFVLYVISLIKDV